MFKTLELKIPPLLLTVYVAILMWLINLYLPKIQWLDRYNIELALPIILIGLFTMFSGVYSFRKAQTTVNPTKPETASTLVTSGIYRITRNPMYLGFALCLFSWSIYLNNLYALVCVFGFVIYINYLQIIPEEKILTGIFGEEFSTYQQKVRRWL